MQKRNGPVRGRPAATIVNEQQPFSGTHRLAGQAVSNTFAERSLARTNASAAKRAKKKQSRPRQPCTCPECCHVLPWASTRSGWLPFGPISRRQWRIVFDLLLPEREKQRCVFSFAYMRGGRWVVGDMALEQAEGLPVWGIA
jgi:hypothetical protein